jgi:hypothetical protein
MPMILDSLGRPLRRRIGFLRAMALERHAGVFPLADAIACCEVPVEENEGSEPSERPQSQQTERE